MTFLVGDHLFEAGPERLVWLPRDVPHIFAARGDQEAWAVRLTSPAGRGDVDPTLRRST
jgi:hypothetical protein